MKAKFTLALTDTERKNLRKNKMKKSDIVNFEPDEISVLLDISLSRAREIYALVEFQQIPSIGIEFAKDLIFLGYYRLSELSGKDGAILLDTFEKKKGFKTDPCVEDQFRLAVDFAKNHDYTKRWWHFTSARKTYRQKFNYPADRPIKNWNEV